MYLACHNIVFQQVIDALYRGFNCRHQTDQCNAHAGSALRMIIVKRCLYLKPFSKHSYATTPLKIESEFDQEITQSQAVDKPKAPRGRATQQSPGRQTKQSNQPSLPHQNDCKTRMVIK